MQRIKSFIYMLLLLLVFSLTACVFFLLTNSTTNVAIIYILYVLLVARFTSGYLYGIIASVFGVIGVNYLFTYPYMELNFSLSGYPVTFLGMLCISIITSTLTTHIKEQVRIASQHEKTMRTLNELNKQLISSDSKAQLIKLILDFSSDFTHSSAAFYVSPPIHFPPVASKMLQESDTTTFNSSTEKTFAQQSYDSRQMLTPSANTEFKCLYVPVCSHKKIWGVLALYNTAQLSFNSDTLAFLNLMVPQLCLAFERQLLSDDHQKLAIESEKEKTRANLLRAVSHDLRTPLTSMIGASNTYLENDCQLSPDEKKQLVSHIAEDANWLLHMVENLLSVTRIQQETTKVKKTLEPLEEVVSEAINRVKKRNAAALINAVIPNEFIMVPMDPTLIEQVIINLLENALKYAHTSDPILLKAEKIIFHNSPYIQIQVIDHGVGIPEERLQTIFDGYNLNQSQTSDTSKGMGIGLSICKTIISAHDGTITAENLSKGMAFTFTLPLQGDDLIE